MPSHKTKPTLESIVTNEPAPLPSLSSKTRTTNAITRASIASFSAGVNSGGPSFPISALFLTQFDVKSGYELKWIRTLGDKVNVKGLEYKSLPSGLHEVEQDVISFIQPKNQPSNSSDSDFDLYYGVSVFHQNLNESRNEDRSSVKMFSLGVLIDPSRLSTASSVWKPLHFISALQYVEPLNELLENWDMEDFVVFEKFFDEYHQDEVLNLALLTSPTTSTLTTFPSIDKDTKKILKQTQQQALKPHHYLLKLPQLIESFGPLVFQIWRHAILRERILLLDSHDINLNDSFVYNISVLSTIPQQLHELVIESGCDRARLTQLNHVQPLYTIGINDLDWLKKLPSTKGYIAFSTDEILLYKSQIYDLSVQLDSKLLTPSDKADLPKFLTSQQSTPGAKDTAPLKATQRDLRRSKFIRSKLHKPENESEEEDEVLNELDQGPQWWNSVTHPFSWKQIAWSSFYFWASSGEPSPFTSTSKTTLIHEAEGLEALHRPKDEIDEALFVVGYFQSLTSRLFRHVAQMIINQESASLTPTSSSLINTTEGLELVLEFTDIQQMGLDPYHYEDWEFAKDVILKYWGDYDDIQGKVKAVKFGSGLSVCCFN